MRNFLITTVAVLTATFGSSANATELQDHLILVNTGRGIGIQYETNHHKCEPENGVTIFGWWSSNERKVVVCVDNHSSKEELSNTIKHEYIHVVQACKGSAIYPELNFPSDMAEELYPEYQHQSENEARFLSEQYDAIDISRLLVQECIMNRE